MPDEKFNSCERHPKPAKIQGEGKLNQYGPFPSAEM